MSSKLSEISVLTAKWGVGFWIPPRQNHRPHEGPDKARALAGGRRDRFPYIVPHQMWDHSHFYLVESWREGTNSQLKPQVVVIFCHYLVRLGGKWAVTRARVARSILSESIRLLLEAAPGAANCS